MGTTTTEQAGSSTAPSSYNLNVPISHCMGSAALDDYTNAIGGQTTVEIGNPPTDVDAARKRLADAEAKAKTARENDGAAIDKEYRVWMDATTRVPGDVSSEYYKALHNWLDANDKFQRTLDEFVKATTTANKDKLEAASVARANADDAYEKAKRAVIDHFKPEDRAAWEAAEKDRVNAAIDLSLANEELRDARAALDDLHLPPSTWLKYAF